MDLTLMMYNQTKVKLDQSILEHSMVVIYSLNLLCIHVKVLLLHNDINGSQQTINVPKITPSVRMAF